MPHPKENARFFRSRNLKERKAIADFKAANPGLPVRHEPIALDDSEPAPCVWPGCLAPCLDTGTLCSSHELLFIATAGVRSPTVKNIIEWNDRLHDRGTWLIPIWSKLRKEQR